MFFALFCNMIKRLFSFVYAFSVGLTMAFGQQADYGKLSPWVQDIVAEQCERPLQRVPGRTAKPVDNRRLTAFVRLTDSLSVSAFADNDCRSLARFGDVHIVSIPLRRLAALSLHPDVVRIEARQGSSIMLDVTPGFANALPAYAGTNLPQAYTGKDVVMGIMDIGFDLTHPTFFDASGTDYRIKALWDQLTTDTVGSRFTVGNDYVGRDRLLAYGHSRDGLDQTHGTHTTGIAAGSGYTTPYRGVAYESDICLVANATGENARLIDSADIYKYTLATDVLGFKYIFDYAKAVGKPCVISFSEGSPQDFRGDDLLYYYMLRKLVGPGRIIVSSAGNNALNNGYISKPLGVKSRGAVLRSDRQNAKLTLRTAGSVMLRLVVVGEATADTIAFSSADVRSRPASVLRDSLPLPGGQLVLSARGYRNVYDSTQTVVDVELTRPGNFNANPYITVEMVGDNAQSELYAAGMRGTHFKNLEGIDGLDGAENTHNLNSPSTSPDVICVGATSHVSSYINMYGHLRTVDFGANGLRSAYSSQGPTYYGRVKPDVVAPGTNIASAYNSFYYESHPDAYDNKYNVKTTVDFQGRTYPWSYNSGTSMASPVVGGAVALWLQAKPDLTPREVMTLLKRTCTHPDPSLTYPNNAYGRGAIDVYAGLLDLLGLTGVKGLSGHQPAGARIGVDTEGVLTIRLDAPASHPFTVQVFSVSGAKLLSATMPAGLTAYRVSLAGLPRGVYAVQLNGEKSIKGSSLVRR